MSNVSMDMKDSPDEAIFDFIESRVERVKWLIDNGYYEDAKFLHEDTKRLAYELDRDLV